MLDRAIKLKIIDSLYDIAMEKKSELPILHGKDIPTFVAADTTHYIKKAGAVSANINMPALHAFIQHLSEDKRVKLAGIAVMKDGKLIAEEYVTPYKREYRHVSFSMCKSVVSMAVGIAVSEGLFLLSDLLCDLMPEYTGFFTKKAMKRITVKHLLTMTAGVKFDELSSYFAEDWCKAFIGSDVCNEPGTEFAYNSLNSYMLAALITKKAGCSLMEYLKPRLFLPLGITDITWDTCPMGIERGGWGMKLSLQDMVKLGKLYLDDGAVIVDGVRKQLVPKAWILESATPHVRFQDKKVTKGYGYHIWCLKDGAILFNGVFGQNVYINREKNLIIACTAGGYELFPEGHLVAQICRFVARQDCFKRDMVRTIWETLSGEFTKKMKLLKNRQEDKQKNDIVLRMLRSYLNKTFYIKDYASSILPMANQLFYSNYMTGIDKLQLKFRGDSLLIVLEENQTLYELKAGYTKQQPYVYQILTLNGKEMPIAVGCEIIGHAGGFELLLRIYYLEEVANKIIKLRFDHEHLYIQAVDSPNMSQFLQKLYGESMMQRTKKLGRMKESGFINTKLKKVLFPSCVGTTRE